MDIINLRNGGNVKINSGTIGTIDVCNPIPAGYVYITIGNLEDELSSTNPIINEMIFADMDSLSLVEVNFYNGIVKEWGAPPDFNYYLNLRPGYKRYYDSNLGGTILIKE